MNQKALFWRLEDLIIRLEVTKVHLDKLSARLDALKVYLDDLFVCLDALKVHLDDLSVRLDDLSGLYFYHLKIFLLLLNQNL